MRAFDDPSDLPEGLRFLAGGGEATRLILQRDWSGHPLGPPQGWSEALKTALSTVLNSPESMILSWGRDDLTFFFNETYFPLLGPRLSWAMGAPFTEVWADAWEQAKPIIDDAFAGRSQRFTDLPWKLDTDRGAADTWWSFSYSRILDADGGIAGLFIFTNETTARVLADAALTASEERYRTLFEAVDVGFCVVEMKYDEAGRAIDYRLEELNPAFARQTGLQDAAGKWVSEAVPGLERHWFDLYGQVGLTGQPIRFENFAEPMGRWFDVHAFRTGAPEDHRVAILFNDITMRKRAEDELRELNVTLEQQVAERTADRNRLWQLSADIMLVAGLDGVIEAVNPAWTRVLGWSEPELVGRPIFDFIHPDDLDHSIRGAEAVGHGESFAKFENRYLRKGGGHRDIEWSARSGEGKIIAVGRDVTDDKARTAALRQAEESLRQAQKMEAVGQLTGGLAHDFNNLLAGISGALELIGARMAQGRFTDVERYLVSAQGAAKRAAALTHRLLAFSRRQTLAPKPTDVNALVAGMTEMVQRTAGPSIVVDLVAAPDLWTALVDGPQLENALLNLCINARDAMPEGGRITIETANRRLDRQDARELDIPEGQYLSLCVTDTGTGMTPEVAAKAFDPFFTTKPIGQGTGLGLSMIYGFAQQSGGQARIRSQPGAGTTVCIHLPRHRGPAEADGAGARPAPPTAAEAGETVLVVDDEPSVRLLITDVLGDFGYTAIEAADGAAGLRVLESDARIDLLVTDVGLPGGMNGRQLADAARARRPDLKVLFITGFAENALLNDGQLEAGMAVLTKPFAVDALGARMRELIHTA